jgi:hypothetical protein
LRNLLVFGGLPWAIRRHVGVIRWGASLKPRLEIVERVGKAPFLINRSRHRGNPSGGWSVTLPAIIEQPVFENFRIGVFFHDVLQELPFHGQADGVRRLIALASSPPPFSGFKSAEQSLANFGRSRGRDHQLRQRRKLPAELCFSIIVT